MSSGVLIGRVAGLFRYPVKSMGSQELLRAEVGENGIVGDRAFGVVDATTGRLLSAKTVPALLAASATYRDDGEVSIVIPVSAETSVSVSSDDRDHDAVLSEWLGRSVLLERPGSTVVSSIDIDVDLSLHGGTGDGVFTFETKPGRFVDSVALHLLSTASLAAAREVYPAGDWSVARFRPNIVVEVSAGDGFVEDGWIGSSIELGNDRSSSAEIFVHKATERCVITTRAIGDAPADREILRTLHKHHAANLGVSADVSGVGVVELGQSLRFA